MSPIPLLQKAHRESLLTTQKVLNGLPMACLSRSDLVAMAALVDELAYWLDRAIYEHDAKSDLLSGAIHVLEAARLVVPPENQ